MKTCLVLIAVIVCFSAYAATDIRGGAWTAEVEGDSLQLTMFRRAHTEESRWNGGGTMGFSVPLSAFTGLTKADATSGAANTTFELRRPAGTIAFDGRFSDGTGAGHFRFTPNEAFIREMESLGYSGFSDDKLLIFTTADFSPQMIRELRAMGYEPTQREVEEIAIFHITAELLRDYARLGYPNVTLKEAVSLRIGRVDAEYIAAMRALGYSTASPRELADAAILGVRPSYVRELQSAGLTGLTLHDLKDLRVGNVTGARIEEYRKLGYTNLTAHQLSEMGIFGVTPDYIRKMQALGYNNVPVEKLKKLKMSGLVR